MPNNALLDCRNLLLLWGLQPGEAKKMKKIYVELAMLCCLVATTLSGCFVPYEDEGDYGGREGYYNREHYRDDEHHRGDEHHDEGRGGERHDERRWDDDEHH